MNPDKTKLQSDISSVFGVNEETSRDVLEKTRHLRQPKDTRPERTDTTNRSSGRTSRTRDTGSTQTQSAEEVQKEMLRGAQAELTSLDKFYAERLREQEQINQKNERSTASISTLTGLAGSTEANVAQQATTKVGQQANNQIRAEQEMKVQSLLGNIRRSALDESRAQRQEARLDEQARIANRAARQQEAATQLTNLAASGVTFEGLREGDPESYNYLANSFGGELALKGAFTLNTPQEQILDKRVEGGKYVIAKQNPLTGKISIETVDLGLPPNFTKTIDAGNRILAIPDNWNGNPANLVSIAKGLTSSQASSGGGGLGSVGGGSGQLTSFNQLSPEQLSRLSGATIAVLQNPAGFKGLTPTLQGQILNELGSVGVDASPLFPDPATANMARAAFTVVRDGKIALDLMDESNIFSKSGTFSAAQRIAASKIPGTDTYEIGKLIQSVKDNIGIDALLNIKREGSGLGAVPQQQLETLQGLLGRLEVSRDPSLLKREIEDVLRMYQDVVKKSGEDLAEIMSAPVDRGRGTLMSPDGTQQVDTSELTPAQIEEAKAAGWQ